MALVMGAARSTFTVLLQKTHPKVQLCSHNTTMHLLFVSLLLSYLALLILHLLDKAAALSDTRSTSSSSLHGWAAAVYIWKMSTWRRDIEVS